jgi:hypothetical protein
LVGHDVVVAIEVSVVESLRPKFEAVLPHLDEVPVRHSGLPVPADEFGVEPKAVGKQEGWHGGLGCQRLR